MNDIQNDDFGLHGELRSSFHNFVRMSSSDFEELMTLIGGKIAKLNTNFRDSISIKDRLAVTLRFLASGDSYQSLMYLCKISVPSISRIIPEVCDALNEVLNDYIKVPTNSAQWQKLANDYNTRWNFPMCVGSMDGKHVVMQSPKYSGSEFFNYKGTFSIVLFAVVDANYNFTYVYIGCQGRISDGGVFKNTGFAKSLSKEMLNLPENASLPEREKRVPFVFVADDAFPLSPNILKPFSGHQDRGSMQRIFNYRLSRARRVVENVFGILASVFRIFRKPILLEPPKVEKIVQTCVLLHNYLRRNTESKNTYTPPGSFDVEDIDSGTIRNGSWRNESQPTASMLPLKPVARKSLQEAQNIRNEYCEYFISDQGQVPWQLKYA
ncbi:uncharacterized protein LOC114342461 [Diabrotica virgifera virgifera]|uniref:DDE Tnp4 domain-containing protein n=1 Tax=Diabrotica virgifera virgifera TaxID=50390 RepID=A0ABM5JU87_DIAVI|nr:uncharacterized protein LOC114342461 [Diabrotica virgifera virgifera]